MPKTYPEELAEWVKGREAKKPRQDKHVVAFLAVKSDVQAALDAGYAMKTIWEHMKETGRLRCRYETFTQHVKRYIKAVPVIAAPAPATSPDSQAKGAKPNPKTAPPASEPPKSEPPKIGGFTFDATPKKEDLL
ncbi:TraK family protein [Acinetobacter baumannii]|uniref:TraK family protein n=1 Tax=Acinetobacter baumannii TaxID=470 RepID=UPI0023409422|nr:TraK family protein [Acinetobacter baumannii]MDC4060045.1 conjugal transfer protein TraK [Acinetobacter baumannii]